MEEKTQVSEVGFEPGTFRSCVDHSNHYATDTPPIPDVLIVLLNNVPITMTSYDTHTTRHLSDTTIHAKSHHRVSPLAPLTWDRCELHQPALFIITFPISTPPRTVRRHHFRFRSLPVPITSGFDHFRFRSLPVSITSGFDHFRFRSLPVPNPHCSPTNRTDPRATLRRQPALFAAITSGFDHFRFRSLPVSITSGSDHFRFRSLPVSITSGSHLVLFADPLLIWG